MKSWLGERQNKAERSRGCYHILKLQGANMTFNFWFKWLITVSFLTIVFGLSLILFNQSALFNVLFNAKVNQLFWGSPAVSAETILFQQWVYSTLGAMMVGWGVMLVYVSAHPFRNKETWSSNCITLSLLLWFIADTTTSYYFHVYINIILNIIILFAFALPLIFTRKYFLK